MDADLARLEIQLNRIASKHDLSAEEVLEEWVERRKHYDSESWRLLDGLPCIMGGLTALCGKSCRQMFSRMSDRGFYRKPQWAGVELPLEDPAHLPREKWLGTLQLPRRRTHAW
jgi:hypothetical protein